MIFERLKTDEGRKAEREPPLVNRLALTGRPHVLEHTRLLSTEILEVALALDQGKSVRPSLEARPAQLNQIVLPEAHRTDLVGTRRPIKDQAPAARAREAHSGRLVIDMLRSHPRILPAEPEPRHHF